MTNKPATEKVTLTLRLKSKHDTDGATHVILSESKDMLVVWPETGIARYTNGKIQPCKATDHDFDNLLRELDPPKTPLKWKKVGDHEEASTTMPVGKIADVCKGSQR